MNTNQPQSISNKDIELLQGAQQGDMQSITELFERFHQSLLSYLYHMLGDIQKAEDIGQDAFIRAFQHLDKLGPPWDFKSWLFRIASNLVIDLLRNDGRYIDEEEYLMEKPAADTRPIERHIELQEQNQMVWNILNKLPTNYRLALILREFNNFSYHEIGISLLCTYENARQLVHRARLRFQEQYMLLQFLTFRPSQCKELGDLLSAYHDNELDDQQSKMVNVHISKCDQCREAKEEMRKVALLLAGLPPLLPSLTWKSQVIQAIRGLLTATSVQLPKTDGTTKSAEETTQNTELLSSNSKEYFSQVKFSPTPWGKGNILIKGKNNPWIWLIPIALFPIVALLTAMITFILFGLLKQDIHQMYNPIPNKTPIIVEVYDETPSPTLTNLPASSSTSTRTPTSTNTITPSLSPTITSTNSPSVPTATILQNSHCRQGPGMDYKIITSLLQGMQVQVDGQNRDSSWWWILLPNSRAHCWVWSGLVEIQGNSLSLPILTPSQIPTKTVTTQQGCWVYMPNKQKNVCVLPCPANAQPGGVCTP